LEGKQYSLLYSLLIPSGYGPPEAILEYPDDISTTSHVVSEPKLSVLIDTANFFWVEEQIAVVGAVTVDVVGK